MFLTSKTYGANTQIRRMPQFQQTVTYKQSMPTRKHQQRMHANRKNANNEIMPTSKRQQHLGANSKTPTATHIPTRRLTPETTTQGER